MDNKRVWLRVLWIFPNAAMYALFIGLTVFVLLHGTEIQAMGELGGWILRLVLLLAAALFGSFRILSWVKQGKL